MTTQTTRPLDAKSARRIWGERGFRLLLSHRANVKEQTARLSEELKLYGISAFVAHVHVKPTKEWIDEIESALTTMDALVALVTPDFHESEWTDQEIGFALGRGLPIISVNLGKEPYGFVGRFQSLGSDWASAATEIAKLLITAPTYFPHYIDVLRACSAFDLGNKLAAPLEGLEELTLKQAVSLMNVYNENDQLKGSYAFNGTKPDKFGPGLVALLSRFHPKAFAHGRGGAIMRWIS